MVLIPALRLLAHATRDFDEVSGRVMNGKAARPLHNAFVVREVRIGALGPARPEALQPRFRIEVHGKRIVPQPIRYTAVQGV